MGDYIERRHFFGEMVRACVRGLAEFSGDAADEDRDGVQQATAASGDFPPELLAMEAERLGLDAEKDKDEVIRAVSAALGSFREDPPPDRD